MHYLMGYNPSSRTTFSQGQRLSSSCLSKIRPTCSVIPLKDSKVILLFFATYKSIKYKLHLYKAYDRLLFLFWSEYSAIRTYVRTYRRSCDIFAHEMCVVKSLEKGYNWLLHTQGPQHKLKEWWIASWKKSWKWIY